MPNQFTNRTELTKLGAPGTFVFRFRGYIFKAYAYIVGTLYIYICVAYAWLA